MLFLLRITIMLYHAVLLYFIMCWKTLSLNYQFLIHFKSICLKLLFGTPNLSKHLDAIGLTTRIKLFQKAALLGTARLLKRVLEA